MKEFKNENNMIYHFENDCFNENGECINKYALKIIEEHKLVEITNEEAEEIRNYKSPEQLAEEESLVTKQIELAKAQKLTEFYEIATELGLI